jgi:16S rRNA processing protein RimM
LIVMGEVCAAYGVRGALKVRTFTAEPEGLLAYGTWWLRTKAEWRDFAVVQSRKHGDTIVASLRGLENRETALKWRGAEVAVPRAALPPLSPGEVYLNDVVGSMVVNRQGATLGRVAGFIETGAHPVLRVADDATGVERLIPMVPAYVDRIDVAAARVVVDWPSES